MDRRVGFHDLHDRLVEDVGSNSWEHHLEQEAWEGRIRELAAHFLHHPADFEQELSWLNSDKARSSVEFGAQLGRLDENLVYWIALSRSAVRSQSEFGTRIFRWCERKHSAQTAVGGSRTCPRKAEWFS